MKNSLKHRASPQFPKLYKLLQQGRSFKTPEALLEALGPECVELMQERAADWLEKSPPAGAGLPENLVNELVTCAMRCNYGGQGCLDLHAFVGLVAIAGGVSSRCFAVKGGNPQVPNGLLELAKPDHHLQDTTVRRVRRSTAAQTWELMVERTRSPAEAMKGQGSPPEQGELQAEGPFDLVVIAHPLARSCISFEGLAAEALDKVTDSKEALGHETGFRRCVTHFVNGTLKRGYFEKGSVSGSSNLEGPPMAILTVAECSAPFYSIGLQLPVDVCKESEAQKILDTALRGEPSTFKVFAPDVLTESQLDEIFENRSGKVDVLDWYPYPEYSVPQPLTPFLLDGQKSSLFYLNAIEETAGAMEMSMVSARNAANLVLQFVERQRQESKDSF